MKKTYLALLACLTVCVVWGSTYLAIRIGVQDIPFLLFAGIRFTIAGAIMLIIARLCGWAFPTSWRDYRALVIVGVVLVQTSKVTPPKEAVDEQPVPAQKAQG